ncbi:hypothetical protein [Brotaphodocola sp.]|uniref:hypothetical protein n=1 Tax=Brotaphodocola sp. TaxID=3073577 RepID=UPI003D7CEF85
MTELGKMILDLIEKGKTTEQIVDLCAVSKYTVRKYRAIYREEHPDEDEDKLPEGWKPTPAKEETEMLQGAVDTARAIARIRRETRVGDRIPLQSLKIARAKNGAEPVNGRKTTGTVVSTSNRRFCIVELSNHAKECILWTDLVTQRRVQREVEEKA